MGKETSKSNDRRVANGDFTRFFKGVGIDIGCGDDPLVGAVKFDKIYGNDAHDLSEFDDGKFDYVYSSHCLEHLEDPDKALGEWWRVLKPGGYMCIVVPDFALYERYNWPSKFNSDHKTIWNPLVLLVLASSFKNAQFIRMQINDDKFDYDNKKSDQTTCGAQAEVEIILRKMDPFWSLDYSTKKINRISEKLDEQKQS